MTNQISWKCIHFKDLTLQQLYDLLKLRQEVFVLEQDCPYVDADGKDSESWHLLAEKDGIIIAYTRIVPKGLSYKDAVSIGRVVTGSSIRGQGIGIQLMQQSIRCAKQLFPEELIRISAQTYLKKFYESFGFEQYSEEYLEDNIPHIGMIHKV